VIDSKVTVLVNSKTPPDDMIPAGQQWQRLDEARYMVPYIDFIMQERFSSSKKCARLMASAKRGNRHLCRPAKKPE